MNNSLHTGIVKVPTAHPDVWELRPRTIVDERGYFTETYNRKNYAAIDIDDWFVQDNQSLSGKWVLRGLHYQYRHPQAKLCRSINGMIYDVAVDVRPHSRYFGKWAGVFLSSFMQNQLYIPVGFAHGMLACTDNAILSYKCSAFHDPDDQRGLIWNDPEVGIDWGNTIPILSKKDRQLPTLRATGF